jgi:hypothetical protein
MTHTRIAVGAEVLIGANPIHPRLAGRTGTVVAFTAGDAKYPAARRRELAGHRCGGNPIVEVPGNGRVLLRPEHLKPADAADTAAWLSAQAMRETARRHGQRVIVCACGCGTLLVTPAPNGRERRFIQGHNTKRRQAA